MKHKKRITLSAAVLSFILTAVLVSPGLAQNLPDASSSDQRTISAAFHPPAPRLFRNRKDMRHQLREVNDAIDRGDYEAWAALMKDRPNADTFVNQDTFQKLQEMHTLLKEGDKEGARKIAEELGLQRFPDKKQLRDFFQRVRDALKNNDYDAWAKLMNEHPNQMTAINPEAFAHMQQRMRQPKPPDPKPAHPRFRRFSGRGGIPNPSQQPPAQ